METGRNATRGQLTDIVTHRCRRVRGANRACIKLIWSAIMSAVSLTQAEADALLALPKVKVDQKEWRYDGNRTKFSIPLLSQDKRENFLLDIERRQIKLKGKYQTRARTTIILARLDFGGAPHRNPDGQDIPCPHLHIYREGYGDGWAVSLPKIYFPDLVDRWELLQSFIKYCNIVDPPNIIRGLYI